MTPRFTLSQHNGFWIVWDSEERMFVDRDVDRGELVDLVDAMNSLDRKFNHSAAN